MKKEEILIELKEAQRLINHCIVELNLPTSISTPRRLPISSIVRSKIDFNLGERNFIKTYGRKMNGEKKFVLLLSRIAKGKTDMDVETKTLVTKWGKMSAKELLGYYNGKYPTAAKTNGWIDSKKRGTYHLESTWADIFS